VAPEEDTYEQFADQQSHCEIDKIRNAEGECRRPGEVQLDGSVLCVPHAELLGLEDHSETMLDEVFEMDQWLESVDGRADESRVRRAEHHRNELVEQLRLNRTRIGLIHDELRKDHDGTT
jgi:chromosome condensin MukBEF ATPase and DNA-binding subunit MukB